MLKALYPGDLEYDVAYQTYAEKAGLVRPARARCRALLCRCGYCLFIVRDRLSGIVRFKVQYDEYGNQETVDAYAVRPRASSGAAAKAGGGAMKKKKIGEKAVDHEDEADGDDGPKIPEHLKILAGDSDKVRLLVLCCVHSKAAHT